MDPVPDWDSKILIYALRTHIHVQWGIQVFVAFDMNPMDWTQAQVILILTGDMNEDPY